MKLSPNQKKYLDDYIKKSGDSIEDFKHSYESKTIDFEGGWLEYSEDDNGDIWVDSMYSSGERKKTQKILKSFFGILKTKGHNKVYFKTKLMHLDWKKICNANTVAHIMEVNI